MKIDVSQLEQEIEKLNHYIVQYENTNRNIFNEFNNASNFWKGEKSLSFFEKLKQDYVKTNINISELKSVEKIYEYIVSSYKELGNAIEFDLSVYDSMITSFNNYINKLTVIINKYNSLDLSFCYEERNYIYSEKIRLENTKKDALDYFDRIKELVDQIRQIEEQVLSNLTNLDIQILNETDNSAFI